MNVNDGTATIIAPTENSTYWTGDFFLDTELQIPEEGILLHLIQTTDGSDLPSIGLVVAQMNGQFERIGLISENNKLLDDYYKILYGMRDDDVSKDDVSEGEDKDRELGEMERRTSISGQSQSQPLRKGIVPYSSMIKELRTIRLG
jgi:hypothetical protein